MDRTTKLSFVSSFVGISLLVVAAVFMGNDLLTEKEQFNRSTEVVTSKTVTALGRLEPQGEIIDVGVASSSQGSRLEKLMVAQGDYVSQGEVIGFLSDRQVALANVQEAQERVRVAQAKLTQIKAGAKQGEIDRQQATSKKLQVELQGVKQTFEAKLNNLQVQLAGEKQEKQAVIARLQAELNNVEKDLERYQFLAQEGAISQSDLDFRRLNVDTADKQLQEAQANYAKVVQTLNEQIKETQAEFRQQQGSLLQEIEAATAELERIKDIRFVDIDVIQAEVEQAQASLASAKAQLEETYIKSPQPGQVLTILTHPGEAISGEGIVRIGNTNSMYAIAEVHESDISKIKLGQQATIASHSLSQDLQGIVEQIGLEIQRQEVVNSDPAANIDAKVVEVEIKLDESSSRRVTSLTNLLVTVTIEIDK